MDVALGLAAMLLLILVAAEVFTNALEHLGERLGISEGVTGSLFAAVGTAMPESIVPLVALLAGGDNPDINAAIGVGAILGAPLMLSTLSLSLMGLSVVRKRGLRGHLRPERSGLERDLAFFLIAFGIALAALFVPTRLDWLRALCAVLLVLTYFVYALLTLGVSAKLVENGHGTQAHAKMYLCRLGMADNMVIVMFQMLFGLVLLVAGARGFVHGVEEASALIGLSPLLLSLLLIPIATELPEKVNSILWIRRDKDTLAFGNITGAMVFQGSILPAIGLMMTPWRANPEVLVGVLVTYGAALWLYWLARRSGGLRIWHLCVNGLLYVVYIVVMVG
jgi:cation:H+ antiporter